MTAPADWQLPPGVDRGVWDYVHNTDLARGYDAELAGTPLLTTDLQYVADRIRPRAKVIDLGCGTGRAAVVLAAGGCDVVGVDLSAAMLSVAAGKANAAGLTVEWKLANIVELDGMANETFDAVICLFGTLGMIQGRENRRRVVANAYRLLRPGGLFIVHVHNRWWTARVPGTRGWFLGDCWRQWRGRDDAGDFAMPPRPGQGGWTMHLFGLNELRRLLTGCGFRICDLTPVTPERPLPLPRFMPGQRAYGFLVTAEKPLR